MHNGHQKIWSNSLQATDLSLPKCNSSEIIQNLMKQQLGFMHRDILIISTWFIQTSCIAHFNWTRVLKYLSVNRNISTWSCTKLQNYLSSFTILNLWTGSQHLGRLETTIFWHDLLQITRKGSNMQTGPYNTRLKRLYHQLRDEEFSLLSA